MAKTEEFGHRFINKHCLAVYLKLMFCILINVVVLVILLNFISFTVIYTVQGCS